MSSLHVFLLLNKLFYTNQIYVLLKSVNHAVVKTSLIWLAAFIIERTDLQEIGGGNWDEQAPGGSVIEVLVPKQ